LKFERDNKIIDILILLIAPEGIEIFEKKFDVTPEQVF